MPTDPWLYICFVGFVISASLWFYLLYKYRTSDRSDLSLDAIGPEGAVQEQEPSISPPAVEPVSVRAFSPPLREALIPVEPKPQAVSKPPLPEPAPIVGSDPGQTASGSLSPALAYLQGLKERLEGLHEELGAVKKQVDDIGRRSEAQFNELLRRLEEVRRPPEASSIETEEARRPLEKEQTAQKPTLPAIPSPQPAPIQEVLTQPTVPLPHPEEPPQESQVVSGKKGPVWPT